MTGTDSSFFPRSWRFLQRPWPEKRRWFYLQWAHSFPNIPAPLRLPFGAWWLARHDSMSMLLVSGQFENTERRFVELFLKPGMTVLDIGAHHGYYTLLSSKLVGDHGRVISFEPSPRERKALRRHVWLNRCANVQIQDVAVGERNGPTTFFVVEEPSTGCNSLKPPAADIKANNHPVQVTVVRLDDWLARNSVRRVDFVKLDVEGGELYALRGALELLKHQPRPIILAEIQDIRTLAWGYSGKDIIGLLEKYSYIWFSVAQDGSIHELDSNAGNLAGNFIACPSERVQEVETLRTTK